MLLTLLPLLTPFAIHAPTKITHVNQDVLLLIPLKLAFVFLLLPSLMRHRMSSDMFKRIPRHAASVQVARRHPDLQASFFPCILH